MSAIAGLAIERIGRSKAELRRFFDVADRIYADDPNWVAPLRDDVASVRRREPLLPARARCSSSSRAGDGADVGRIAAIVDRNHNEFHGEKTAFFGFFESSDDPAVAGAAVRGRRRSGRRERKMTVLRGPVNPTLNDEAGLLVDGFDSPPGPHDDLQPALLRRRCRGRRVPQGEGPARLLVRARARSRSSACRASPSGSASAEPDIVVRNISKGEPRRRTCRRSARSTTAPGRRTGASCR